MKRLALIMIAVGGAGLAVPAPAAARQSGPPTAGAKALVHTSATRAQLAKQAKIRAFFAMTRALGKVPRSCRLKGKKLWGKVKIVKHWPDFKVKIVEHFADLKVKWVKHWPDKCGKWQKVDHWPNFKIQFVKNFPDFTIKIVRHWPGVK